MSDVLLSRIIKYLNGTVFYDGYYLFCTFVVTNYQQMLDFSFDEVCSKSQVDSRTIMSFLQYLGFNDYSEFRNKLIEDDILRNDQIRARMLSISKDELFKLINVRGICVNNYIVSICKDIYEAKRVIFLGGLFPMSIAVDFQTDLITLGKTVLQYHAYDAQLSFNEDDFVIFITSTGRSLRDFMIKNPLQSLSKGKTLLVSQNQLLENEDLSCCKYFFSLPGKFDGVMFNYQIMAILDLIRIIYYQEYFIKENKKYEK